MADESPRWTCRATRAVSAASRFRSRLVVVIAGLAYGAHVNAAQNLARAHIASGFGFWNNTAGFDISQTLIAYSASTSTFGRAFWVGLLNTLLVAAIGIVLATVLGFIVGIARLSRNWLVARLAGGYVELIRNVPLLLQLLFWYNAVLKSLPQLRDSVALPGGGILNNRGLFLPRPEFGAGFRASFIALAARHRRRDCAAWSGRAGAGTRTGAEVPRCSGRRSALIVGLPLAAFALAGFPLGFNIPQIGPLQCQRRRRNPAGIRRARCWRCRSIPRPSSPRWCAPACSPCRPARSRPRRRSACALGATLRLVVVPQAMRVIIPPLTSQYLNLIKNSSLAVAIGYPDLVQVFAGSVLNITGQAVEVIAITMAVYLAISLFTSLLMNLYGARDRDRGALTAMSAIGDQLLSAPDCRRSALPPPAARRRRGRLAAGQSAFQSRQHRADARLRSVRSSGRCRRCCGFS